MPLIFELIFSFQIFLKEISVTMIGWFQRLFVRISFYTFASQKLRRIFLTNIQPAVVKVDLGGCVAWVVLVAACWSAEAVSPAVLGFPPPTADDL